jgi:hypothetical protein
MYGAPPAPVLAAELADELCAAEVTAAVALAELEVVVGA